MATKTIGSGKDFATLALWASYIDGLDTLSEPEVGEIFGEHVGSSTFVVDIDGATASSVNTLTLRCGAGQSFREHPDKLTNELVYDAAHGAGIRNDQGYGGGVRSNVSFTKLEGLQIKAGSANGAQRAYENADPDSTVDWCIIEGGGNSPIRTEGRFKIRNSIIVGRASSANSGIVLQGGTDHWVYNCLLVRPSNLGTGGPAINTNYVTTGTIKCRNVAAFNFAKFLNKSPNSAGAILDIDYCASDLATIEGSGTHNLTSLTYADQFEDTTGDWRLKTGSDLIDAGIATEVTDDILGTSRPQGSAYDIGVQEFLAAGGSTPFIAELTLPAFGFDANTLIRFNDWMASLTAPAFTWAANAITQVDAILIELTTPAFNWTANSLNRLNEYLASLSAPAFSWVANAVKWTTGTLIDLTAPAFNWTGNALTRINDYIAFLSAPVFDFAGRVLNLVDAFGDLVRQGSALAGKHIRRLMRRGR